MEPPRCKKCGSSQIYFTEKQVCCRRCGSKYDREDDDKKELNSNN